MNAVAVGVVDQISSLVDRDGGRVEFLRFEGNTAVVRYDAGTETDCDRCAWTTDTLADFVLEALKDRALPVEVVRVVEAKSDDS